MSEYLRYEGIHHRIVMSYLCAFFKVNSIYFASRYILYQNKTKADYEYQLINHKYLFKIKLSIL